MGPPTNHLPIKRKAGQVKLNVENDYMIDDLGDEVTDVTTIDAAKESLNNVDDDIITISDKNI